MIVFSNQRRIRLAAVGALVVALGLTGCGRKGGLDLPPDAALPVQTAEPVAGAPPAQPVPVQPAIRDNGGLENGKPVAPRAGGKNTPFILDWLLN